MRARPITLWLALLGAACSETEALAPPQPLAQAAPANVAAQPASAAAKAPEVTPKTTAAPPQAGGVSRTPSQPDAGHARPADDADSGRPPADAGVTSQPDAAIEPSLCPDGYPRGSTGTSARKLLAVKPSPEGVTVCPNGQVFLSLDDGRIMRLSSDGQQLELWAELTGLQPAGISCDEQNHLFVAVYAVRSGGAAAGVVRIDGQGGEASALPAPTEVSPLAAYNGILAVAGLGVYATDSGAGWVVRMHEATPGHYVSEIVARNIPIANGLAYDTARRKLYVASSLDFAVYAFDLAQDGSLAGRSKVMTTSASFFDGVAVDEHGTVYVADYTSGTLVRLPDAATIATLPTPASLAFRGGTLFITDYRLNQPEAEGGLYAIELGMCSGQLLTP